MQKRTNNNDIKFSKIPTPSMPKMLNNNDITVSKIPALKYATIFRSKNIRNFLYPTSSVNNNPVADVNNTSHENKTPIVDLNNTQNWKNTSPKNTPVRDVNNTPAVAVNKTSVVDLKKTLRGKKTSHIKKTSVTDLKKTQITDFNKIKSKKNTPSGNNTPVDNLKKTPKVNETPAIGVNKTSVVDFKKIRSKKNISMVNFKNITSGKNTSVVDLKKIKSKKNTSSVNETLIIDLNNIPKVKKTSPRKKNPVVDVNNNPPIAVNKMPVAYIKKTPVAHVNHTSSGKKTSHGKKITHENNTSPKNNNVNKNKISKIDDKLYKNFISSIKNDSKRGNLNISNPKPFSTKDSNRSYTDIKSNQLQYNGQREGSITNKITKQSSLKQNNQRFVAKKNQRYGKSYRRKIDPKVKWRAILASYPKCLLDGQLSVITGFNIPFNLNFPLLKGLFLGQKLILFSNIKGLFFFLTFWIISLLSLFLLPFYIPTFFIIRLIHLFLFKFNNFKQNSIYYFSKLYASRFFIFNTTNNIISASIASFDKFNNILVAFFGMHSRNIGAKLLSNYIAFKLGQYFTIQEIIYPIINDLRTSPRLSGFRITIAGRLTRKERAAFIIKQNGKVTLSNKSALIDYASEFKIMKFGVVGIKVWLQKKKTKPYYYKFLFRNLLFFIFDCFYMYNQGVKTFSINKKFTACFIQKRGKKNITNICNKNAVSSVVNYSVNSTNITPENNTTPDNNTSTPENNTPENNTTPDKKAFIAEKNLLPDVETPTTSPAFGIYHTKGVYVQDSTGHPSVIKKTDLQNETISNMSLTHKVPDPSTFKKHNQTLIKAEFLGLDEKGKKQYVFVSSKVIPTQQVVSKGYDKDKSNYYNKPHFHNILHDLHISARLFHLQKDGALLYEINKREADILEYKLNLKTQEKNEILQQKAVKSVEKTKFYEEMQKENKQQIAKYKKPFDNDKHNEQD